VASQCSKCGKPMGPYAGARCRKCKQHKPDKPAPKKPKIKRICEKCGDEVPQRYRRLLCDKCRKERNLARNYSKGKTCKECERPISNPNQSGYCLRCYKDSEQGRKVRSQFGHEVRVGLMTCDYLKADE
jgi:hypothetical protein